MGEMWPGENPVAGGSMWKRRRKKKMVMMIDNQRKKQQTKRPYIIPHKHTIHKLQRAHHDQKRHEHVNQLHALRRGVEVVLP